MKFWNIIKNYKKDLSVNDYKDCSQLYSPIKIELKLVENYYGKFINIPNKQEEYYHIYFDNLNKEIKRNYLKEKEKVKIIKIIIDYQVISFRKLFDNCECISSIIFVKFNRINITDMSHMFYGCSSLKEINFSNFNTNNVTKMSSMFCKCSSLKEINLSNFNTNNVTNMNFMFAECKKLKALNLFNFNTNKVKNMSYMFADCPLLKELNFSNFKVNTETNTDCMFNSCISLKELNLFNCNDYTKKIIKKLIKNI